MPASLQTLKERLGEAEAAQHSLLTGAKAARVMADGHAVEYTAANAGDLARYITQLRGEISRAGGTCADGGRRRRAIRPFF